MKILVFVLLWTGSQAFTTLPLSRNRVSALHHYSTLKESPEEIKHDIEEMRQEAARRLEALTKQMDELKQQTEKHDKEARKKELLQAATQAMDAKELPVQDREAVQALENEIFDEIAAPSSPPSSLDSLEGDWTDTSMLHKRAQQQNAHQQQHTVVEPPVNTELLTNTRWKVGFNIGRESGTWMPKEWGHSGDRLLFQVKLDLTDEPLYEREEFFQGPAGAKRLKVQESWVVPVGVGNNSHGRQPIRVKSTGGYKVLPGHGPLGTNIVRFYIELEEDVRPRPDSDVYCPQGRVYATCGYFPILPKQKGTRSLKEILEEEHRAVVVRYEDLQNQLATDDRIFSMDRLKLMKESYDVKRELEKVTRNLQEARQRDPERSQLRLTRDGRVGLTKEGGVCRKVYKGVALEYHILGRIELACIDTREEHDEYQELVHQLQP